MSAIHYSHPSELSTSLPLPPPRARLVGFLHDDDCPIPPEYQDRPRPDRWEFTREGRAMLCYWQLVSAGTLAEPSDHPASVREVSLDNSSDSCEGKAKLLALRRFVACDSFSKYEDHLSRRGRRRDQGDLIFLPHELPGAGRFVGKEDFRIQAGLHRFSCKCGLANTPLLALWQSAVCDGDDEHYENSAAYAWYTIHAKRQDVYGASGYEAPEWDPFPDGREVKPRLDSERETNEQRRVRETRWSATRNTGRVLPPEMFQQGAWQPACRVPSGPAFSDKSSWTPEQEQMWEETVVKEQEQREMRKAVLTSEAERQEQAGVQRLAIRSGSVAVSGERPTAASVMATAVAGPSSGTSGSSSRAVGLSSQTSEATMSTHLVQNGGTGSVTAPCHELGHGEKWWVTPAKGRRPLQIVAPAEMSETKAARDERGQSPAGIDEESVPVGRICIND